MKRLIFLTLLSLFSALFFAYLPSDNGFRVAHVTFSNVTDTWNIHNQDVGILQEIAKQPFTYLGKGRQCYAFTSVDGKWVLKFFKCQRLRLSPTYECIDSLGILPKFIEAKRKEKKDRMKRLFMSAYIASTRLFSDTGIAYIQLTPNKEKILPTVTLLLNGRKKEYIDLNSTPFCLQKKGEFVLPVLEKLIASGDFEAAKKRLDQLLELVVDKRKKRVGQHDPALIKRNNVGFLEDRAIFLDIGSFKYTNQCEHFKSEKRQLRPLVIWLQNKNPMLASYFEQKVNAL